MAHPPTVVELDRMNLLQFVLAFLLVVMSSAVLAQTTGALNPNPAPSQPAVNEDVPPGGCMPVGLTASGEIVFPIQCKEFIEQHRGKALEPKPANLEEKSATKQSDAIAPVNIQPATKPSEVVPVKPAEVVPNKPAEVIKLQKRAENKPRERNNVDGCEHYRTYNPKSESYRGYDGRRHSCR